MKIKVIPEGRPGIFLVEKQNILEWLKGYKKKEIHNILPSGAFMIGADWKKKQVVADIKRSEKIAVLIGEAQKKNFRHALSVIVDNELKLFDIGEITEEDLDVTSVLERERK